MTKPPEFPALYLSIAHDCPYLPDETATSLLFDPSSEVTDTMYSAAVRLGFRRSGDMVYRPYCLSCTACVPVRIPVAQFQPNRSQRRCSQSNQDLSIAFLDMDYDTEHFKLFKRYQRWKHPGDAMDHGDRERYISSMLDTPVQSALLEIRKERELLSVSVIDMLDDGFSAVYTFFSPEYAERSLGTYAILALLAKARTIGVAHIYLGYWIKNCGKMSYKTRFQALEGYIDNGWQALTD